LAADHYEVGYYVGATYHVIDDAIGSSTRSCLWTTPGNASENIKVRVQAHNATDSVLASDISDQAFALLTPRFAWNSQGIRVCTADLYRQSLRMIADGAGGSILVWQDERNGSLDIYAQRINANGNVVWTSSGAAICIAAGDQRFPQIVADGAGGAIIAWTDDRSGSSMRAIYAQRISAGGNVLWTTNGVIIANACPVDCLFSEGAFDMPVLVTDGAGGAIIGFRHYIGYPLVNELYATRISASGSLLWGEGIALSTATGGRAALKGVLDSSGGAIFVWTDTRNDSPDFYAQRINANGTVLWQENGLAICTAPIAPSLPDIIEDGSGGAILCWEESGDAENHKVYAQRLDSNGNVLWNSSGVTLFDTAVHSPYALEPKLTTDGSGGAIIVWGDKRVETPTDRLNIYAQRVDANGSIRWATNGVAVCSVLGDQQSPAITYDGEGGALIFWQDMREGNDNWDIYMQRVSSSGTLQWYGNAEPLCLELAQQSALQVTKSHNGNVIIAWFDYRNGSSGGTHPKPMDFYAQKLAGYFVWPPACNITYEFFKVSNGQQVSRFFMNGCPQGDFEFVRATLEFNVADLTRDIDRTEITLVKPDSLITFWRNGTICADSNVSLDNAVNGKVKTTITHAHFSRDWALNGYTVMGRDVDILIDGDYLGSMEALTVKSPDYTGDGTVNSNDMYYFSLTHNKSSGKPGYNGWFDFTGDNKVNISDYTHMGVHQNHHEPDPYQPSSPAEATEAGVKLIAREGQEQGRIELALYLENANGITTACLGLKNDLGKYEYLGFKPNTEADAGMLVAPVSRGGVDVLFVSAFDVKPNPDGEIELGTIEFALKDQTDLSAIGTDLSVQFGNVRYADGAIKYLKVEGYETEQPTPRPVNYLANAFPNPFNPATTINYSIAEETPVNLSIYNVNGQLVRTLVNETQKSKAYSVIWNGKDNRGGAVQSGIYFYRIKTNSFAQSKKFVLVR
jgi:hypothetical protein